MKRLHVASDEEIKRGETTDIYFKRTEEILREKNLDQVRVVADVSTTSFPKNWPWAILGGIEELASTMKDYPVDIYCMPEGAVFRPYQPVVRVEGKYADFAVMETALLGLISQASAITTAAARCRILAENKPIYSFGARRVHPAITPMVDRAAFIGGCEGVSGLAGAKLIGEEAVGTMPHALIIVFGDQIEAWKAFHDVMEKEVLRIALVDTYYDEKIEAVMAAEALGKNLFAVRLDTPSSRRGDFAEIVEETRWELDIRGYKDVKIFVSGGITEELIPKLSEAGADAFGVGGTIATAPVIDFAMDIVEVEGEPKAKRGKLGGRKQVFRCTNCLTDTLALADDKPKKCSVCGTKTKPLLIKLIENGKIIADLPTPKEIREYVLEQLSKLKLER